ncbi:TetR/AcrR family transcriptional regulator [Inconstantimicrobium mannanitabidum]|uniref:TetR family transcriptional regulator n=1 Tax=Inconstantimicrobium mannanitabidum TaxID=1604901 RepID=A0ACB5RDD3_9CLOT|nr:TetR/AcrR family transcriptional regulator [Clostridium sp. TW13]GKX67274.1 TetR family transcriptional regulator [Clostridium sp. TW13]
MDEQKIDRRVRKTKSTLLRCLTELMSKKKINDITVKELTDLADVNRSTFYLYYKDIFDMLEQVESEMLEEFKKVFHIIAKDNNDTKLLYFYTYIFEYVQNNAEMCKILLGPDGDNSFKEKFKKVILQTKPPFGDSIPQIKMHYLRPYAISGCIGLIQQWIEDGLDIPPKDMAVITTEIINKLTKDL